MLAEVEHSGAVLVAKAGSVFIGFAAGWILKDNVIEETPDSNRFGLISNICVLAPYRRRRIATRLLDALSERLCRAGVQRIRLAVLAANRIARPSTSMRGLRREKWSMKRWSEPTALSYEPHSPDDSATGTAIQI
jgi:GNAT superfamily N-acetyltransferase